VKQCKCGGLESTDLYKLPGSLIGIDEELDDAAYRVLKQFTGLVKVDMMQFRTFGSVDRLSNSSDKIWLTRFYNLDNDFERIITIGYLSLIRIDRQFEKLNSDYLACWMPLSVLPKLAFDHNEIVTFLEHKNELTELIDESFNGIQVLFGKEKDSFVIGNSSMISSQVKKDGKTAGSLGIIGPMRLDYKKVIPYIEYFTKKISDIISEEDIPDTPGKGPEEE
jgi:ADP-ribose pyrophosphatase YjhB (NUDIX family)